MMQHYEFTLVLKQVDADTPDLEDHLFTAGCDDALIYSRNGTVYLDFARKAATLEQAVLSAIRAVEGSKLGALVASVAPDSLVTESEAAKRLQVNRQAILLWIKGERRKAIPFPKPVMGLAGNSPLWRWYDIVAWAYKSQVLDEHHAKPMLLGAELLEYINHVLALRMLGAQTSTGIAKVLSKLAELGERLSKRAK